MMMLLVESWSGNRDPGSSDDNDDDDNTDGDYDDANSDDEDDGGILVGRQKTRP